MSNTTEDYTDNKINRSLRHQYKSKLISERFEVDEEELVELKIPIKRVRKIN